MNDNKIDLFKVNETLAYKFFQMPKELFRNPYYAQNLSLESKVAYTLLLDRLELSRINKWFNDKGEIYLIYTRQELIKELKIGNGTACKVFNELKKCNLIQEERLGQGLANRIYIGKIQSEELESFKNRIYRDADSEYLEVLDSISRNAIWHTNNTDINNTDNIYNKDEKILFGDKVNLYVAELKELVDKYGKEKTAKIIVTLDLYKKANGKEYASDYDAIHSWVINKVERDERFNNKNTNNNKPSIKYKSLSQDEINDLEQFYDIY